MKRGLVAFGLTVLAVFVGGVLVVPALFLEPSLTVLAVVLVLAELGFAAVAFVFVLAGETGWDYVKPGVGDRRRATRSVVVGGAGLAAFAFTVIASVNLAGIRTVPSVAVDTPFHIPSLLLMMIPLSILVVAPAEELFFRGVLQTYLQGATTPRKAVLSAGTLFALVHVPNYLQLPSLTAMAVMTGVILIVGLGIGYAYEQSESLPVAVGIHALYNSLMMLGWYFLVTRGVVAF